MTRFLVVYASTHGQTAKIAERIGETLRREGHDVSVEPFGSADAPTGYDSVVAGASLHNGRHQHEAVDWVRAHAVTLNAMPSAFFSVSLTAADDTDEARAATRSCIDDFLDETGWTPRTVVPVAGALQYREYDFMTRLLMRLMMRRGGHPTDISRDFEYTDWARVERFAQECSQMSGVPAR